jgi:hypothetical protein
MYANRRPSSFPFLSPSDLLDAVPRQHDDDDYSIDSDGKMYEDLSNILSFLDRYWDAMCKYNTLRP